MEKYKEHFRLSVADAINYTKDFNIFDKNSKLKGEEIGDGNINYIFRIIDETNNKSVVLKQADKFLRSSGRPLDLARSKIEAEILRIEGQYSEKSVPKIYRYDDIMCVIVMEDISEFKNLRKELLEEKIFPNFSDEISSFLVDTLLPTTDLVMDSAEKKDKVQTFINKELCDISECLVFTEPYDDYKKRNIILKENETLVKEKLYDDKELHLEVSKLKNNFMNNAQALIHGDLHSGSIFINERGIKVIDPEFAFYGPMGYDIGNVIGNLYFPLINKKYLMKASEDKEKFIKWLSTSIEEIYDMFIYKFKNKYKELVKKPLYHEENFMDWYLSEVLADSLGSAGLEIIRRVVGDTKVIEIEGIENIEKRILVERELLEIGIRFIKERYKIKKGNQL
ncbi:MAG: S-methyl-5-thioribose kinase [Fusobacterium sp. JB021]|nr:S-methyl-5-thioribose kinase [Fusobacterium sp. JB020]MDP0493416.1 S-methyl-5-thioribose kinase [Fusobacterium sp. JB021]MDP0507650.1 S-methyl-5-thioribose kinase [Fusobacterium sp. JB019]